MTEGYRHGELLWAISNITDLLWPEWCGNSAPVREVGMDAGIWCAWAARSTGRTDSASTAVALLRLVVLFRATWAWFQRQKGRRASEEEKSGSKVGWLELVIQPDRYLDSIFQDKFFCPTSYLDLEFRTEPSQVHRKKCCFTPPTGSSKSTEPSGKFCSCGMRSHMKLKQQFLNISALGGIDYDIRAVNNGSTEAKGWGMLIIQLCCSLLGSPGKERDDKVDLVAVSEHLGHVLQVPFQASKHAAELCWSLLEWGIL